MNWDAIFGETVRVLSKRIRNRSSFFEAMYHQVFAARDKRWLDDERATLLAQMMAEAGRSSSQLFQDIWVSFETGGKRDGFFVEFGATDGVSLSNTLMLERDLGWSGVLGEPNPVWLSELRQNRPLSRIATECVWSRSGEMLTFLATSAKELGTVSTFATNDRHAKARESHRPVTVPSISLNDLLVANNAPLEIDYISIDTEGSEYEILQGFDFDRWNVQLFSIEHNHTENEKRIVDLMEGKGYQRRFPEFSRFDAWFRKRS